MSDAPKVFRPQPGPQEAFHASPADIVIYGGSAGGGKSYSLLLEQLRHVKNPNFRGVLFRRDYSQIMHPGGLWDEAGKMYPFCKGEALIGLGKYKFPSGAEISFHHLHLESDVYAWQGSQVPLFCFDELTHFTAEQFWYMVGRNRSTCGVRPYIRASCNPELDSWVEKLIAWWINQDDASSSYGLPIPDRSGVLRWFIRIDDSLEWADTPGELKAKFGGAVMPKSLTFIPAKLTDNKILMEADPGYLANLQAQTRLERARLLDGNWKAAPNPGDWFRRSDFKMVAAPEPGTEFVRGWDFAASEPSESNPNPDRSATVLMGRQPSGRYVVAHARREAWKTGKVEALVRAYAIQNGHTVPVAIPIDPGAGGVGMVDHYVSALSGYPVRPRPIRKGKTVYAEPFAIQVQRGMVDVVIAPWNDFYFKELESFPSPKVHDDLVDASSIAFAEVVGYNDSWIAAVEADDEKDGVPKSAALQEIDDINFLDREVEGLLETGIPNTRTEDDATDWMG